MVAREGENPICPGRWSRQRDGRWSGIIQTGNTVRHTKCGRIRGMVVGEGGRSSGVLLYNHILCVLSVVGFESCPAVIVDVSNVPEMTEVRVTEQGVVFGASVTLSTMEEFLQETIEHLPGRFTLVH